MSQVRDLIDAIAAGNALETENAFNAAIAEKISGRLETMRADYAKTMFAAPEAAVVEEEAEQVDEAKKKKAKSDTSC